MPVMQRRLKRVFICFLYQTLFSAFDLHVAGKISQNRTRTGRQSEKSHIADFSAGSSQVCLRGHVESLGIFLGVGRTFTANGTGAVARIIPATNVGIGLSSYALFLDDRCERHDSAHSSKVKFTQNFRSAFVTQFRTVSLPPASQPFLLRVFTTFARHHFESAESASAFHEMATVSLPRLEV